MNRIAASPDFSKDFDKMGKFERKNESRSLTMMTPAKRRAGIGLSTPEDEADRKETTRH